MNICLVYILSSVMVSIRKQPFFPQTSIVLSFNHCKENIFDSITFASNI